MIKTKFHRCMDFSLSEGGSCSYDAKRKGDIKVTFEGTQGPSSGKH